jgi:membrane carboxypeptidase/penicillin-binding protein
VTTVWTGFDQPESLGRREFGGTVALPIWMNYMGAALKDKPPHTQPEPEGILSLRVDPVSGRAASPSTPKPTSNCSRPKTRRRRSTSWATARTGQPAASG